MTTVTKYSSSIFWRWKSRNEWSIQAELDQCRFNITLSSTRSPRMIFIKRKSRCCKQMELELPKLNFPKCKYFLWANCWPLCMWWIHMWPNMCLLTLPISLPTDPPQIADHLPLSPILLPGIALSYSSLRLFWTNVPPGLRVLQVQRTSMRIKGPLDQVLRRSMPPSGHKFPWPLWPRDDTDHYAWVFVCEVPNCGHAVHIHSTSLSLPETVKHKRRSHPLNLTHHVVGNRKMEGINLLQFLWEMERVEASCLLLQGMCFITHISCLASEVCALRCLESHISDFWWKLIGKTTLKFHTKVYN